MGREAEWLQHNKVREGGHFILYGFEFWITGMHCLLKIKFLKYF